MGGNSVKIFYFPSEKGSSIIRKNLLPKVGLFLTFIIFLPLSVFSLEKGGKYSQVRVTSLEGVSIPFKSIFTI